MSSSDSDDSDGEAFYSSIVKNVALLRDQYRKEKTTENLRSTTNELGNKSSHLKNYTAHGANDSLVDLLTDDCIVDEIIAKNSKPTRKRKKNVDNDAEFVVDKNKTTKATRGRKRGRGSKSNVSDGTRDINSSIGNLSNAKRGDTNESSNNTSVTSEGLSGNKSPQKRGRLDRIVKKSTNRPPAKRRSRNRGRSGIISAAPSDIYPTYSVGNTDEYPDQSAEVELFSTKSTEESMKEPDDVINISEEMYDDNEELSVKVIWQGFDIFKFTIYKYEKLTKIYELFTKKENISADKLLLTYNEKVVTVNDTPASIDYNVAKFINGGLKLNTIGSTNNRKSGPKIKIKFQCQEMKKPFDVLIPKNEKLSIAMSKCAEHLSLPLSKLKFNFDGDTILGTSMPQDIDLENGDCIDVVVILS